MSTLLLATTVALLAVPWAVGVTVLTDGHIAMVAWDSPVLGVELLGFVVVLLVALSVPTIGGFVAAIALARDLRRA